MIRTTRTKHAPIPFYFKSARWFYQITRKDAKKVLDRIENHFRDCIFNSKFW